MNMKEGPIDGAKGDGTEDGRWAWVGWGKVVVGKWRQLYLNINKKKSIKKENHYGRMIITYLSQLIVNSCFCYL